MSVRRATRLRLLVCAHELSPEQGSECAVGWHIVTRLARDHDVTVLCASGSQHRPSAYKAAVERHLRTHGRIPGLTFVFVDQPRGARLIAALNRALFGAGGIGFPLLFYWALRLWHRAAQRRAAALDAQAFDVVHHLTPIAFWGGSSLWKLGRPYVWGPISGAGKLAAPFARWLGARVLLFELSRAGFNRLIAATSLELRRSIRRAALVLVVGPEEAELVERLGGAPPVRMLESGAPAERGTAERRADPNATLRLCWAGQHIDRKALPLLLHALAAPRLRARVELHVLGAGPRTEAWQKLARRLELTGIVWHGQLSHRDALERMRSADVLVHTSIREGTPHVVLEAMSEGLPVICHDVAGMATAVTEHCGIKVPLDDPSTSVAGFRAAVERLDEDRALLRTLSSGARRRAAELTWDAKAAELARLYERCVIGHARAEPDAAPLFRA